ncbi:MAG: hypothetical protein FJZ47_11585 [Candidatus Tectomicrobia bacterium]|uniref:Uncharacterized protein n=1 Tax=Tectimicrobiota bacterium TaxID=2528274 RepID=A0A938B458_UNCTE|nr:hypothetical protein [Candidatus Tectomicrobia bacterium]
MRGGSLYRLWSVVGLTLLLAGCVTEAMITQMSLAEQSEFYTYRKVMTFAQERAYLAKGSAAARTGYLSEIGLAQRFQAFEAEDREAILGGWPRPGMRADALRFVWGEPYYTDGDARRSAHWHYLGSSFARGNTGNSLSNSNNRVDVYLVDDRVVGWVDVVPSSNDGSEDNRRN